MNLLTRQAKWTLTGVLSLAITACGGSDAAKQEGVCAKAQPLLARPGARLFLTSSLLSRLQVRAAAGEAAWKSLAKHCDELATGTVYPPNGPAYPDHPDLGQGYQGEEYLPAVASLGLCYRTTSGVDDTAAARYAAAGARVLEAMSTPVAAGGQPPQTDSGYGIRNYGVGMALGYDWLYPALTSSTRQRVMSALDTWIDWYDTNGFSRNDPIGNYFIGYFQAKTLGALATEGDDPKASGYLSDVENRLWAKLVKPAFVASMAGGGWPEGWGYGPRAVRGVAEILWAVKTAKGLDWAEQVPQPRDQAAYISYFAWPSFDRMDDQGTVRSGIDLSPSALLASSLATILQRLGDAAAKPAAQFAADVVAKAGDDRRPWEKFLYGDPALPKAPYTTRPLSYHAAGPGHVAVRSSWKSDAVWGAFENGAYINAPDSGEQMFNAGNLSVVAGAEPVLINATGFIPTSAGTAGEDFVYTDSWGGGGRRLYNSFFVDDSANNPYSPGQSSRGPADSNAHVERYEDAGAFVRARAANVEDQYGTADGGRPVTAFTRDLVYVRPGSFVLFDRTTVAKASADQWIAFHTARAPIKAPGGDPSSVHYDLAPGGASGSIRVLLPTGASTKIVSLPGGSARLEAHAPKAGADQQWLSVITAGAAGTEPVRLSPADGNVLSGAMLGVHLRGARDQIVLFASGHSAAAQATGVEYEVAQTTDADHVLVDLAVAADGYLVSASASGDLLTIRVARGGPLHVSKAGTLGFIVTKSGAVAEQPTPAPEPEPPGDPPREPGSDPDNGIPAPPEGDLPIDPRPSNGVPNASSSPLCP